MNGEEKRIWQIGERRLLESTPLVPVAVVKYTKVNVCVCFGLVGGNLVFLSLLLRGKR